MRVSFLLPAILVLATAWPTTAQVGDDDKLPAITTYVYETTPRKPGPDFVRSLRVPPGYKINVFASALGNSRFIAVAANGDVYVNRNTQGDVIRLRDANNDGSADGPPEVVARRSGLLGMTVHEGRLYAATAAELFVGDLRPDGNIGPLTRLIKDLPSAGQHYTRHMKFGPDGMLYLGIGSTCNACSESSPESAAVLRIAPDGKRRTIFASGLRHTIGFDWHPKTGELWGWDQGIDWLGNDLQREEVNKIEAGKRYGWPYVMEDGKEYPQLEPPGDITNAQWAAVSRKPALLYTAHAAGMQMVFHPGGGVMGAEAAGDAFVTMRGSWNRKPASGYELVRIRFDPQGQANRIEPFITGFLSADGASNYGRLCGMAIARDGALLFSDDTNGVIYRVVREGAAGGYTPPKPPAAAMLAQTGQGANVPLALARPETRATREAAIQVSSPAFRNDAPIPATYTDYGDSVSPPLEWTTVPGAQSYALIMEDPEGRQKPTIHWIAWNIPAGVTRLPAGLPERDRLAGDGLDGLMQGAATRGSTGYVGPRPAVGDPPHHYHFQVVALDRKLDLPLGATRDELLAAMRGHVIGRGDLVGTVQQATEPAQ